MRFLSFLLMLVVPFISACATSAESTAPEVEDIIAKRHFISIGEMHTDGQQKLLCVGTAPDEYALWNPLDDTLSQPIKGKNCNPEKKYRPMWNSVDYKPLNGRVEERKETSFSGGVGIYSKSDGSFNHCGSSLKSYFSVEFPDQPAHEFYVIIKLKNEQEYTIEKWCDGAWGKRQVVHQKYDVVFDLSSIAINNGKTLIYSSERRSIQPVLLLVRSLPKSLWSSAGNVFLVPAADLHSKLYNTYDLDKRYKFLLSAIGQ